MRADIPEDIKPDTTVANSAALSVWCQDHVDGFRGPVSLKKFTTGQSNPTYLLTARSGRYVLRRKPPGALLPSAHAVDREYRVMEALANTDVPVPHMLALCEEDEIIGSMFFVMEYLEGRTFLDPALPQLGPAQRRELYVEQVRILACLANLDAESIGLGDYGKPGDYVARQVNRWTRQYRASATGVIADMEHLIDWLPAHLPAEDYRPALVHGDFRLDNLLVHPTRMEIIGVLDWELSTLGHPFVDFSYWSTMLRLPRETHHKGLAGLDRRALGIPAEQELIDLFYKSVKRDKTMDKTDKKGTDPFLPSPFYQRDWSFWVAFHGFRFAAIVQGVMKRHLDGNASSAVAFEVGRMARPVAALGWAAARQYKE